MAGVSSVLSKLSTWKNLEEPVPADTQRSNPIQRGYERENARGAAAGASRVACSPPQLQGNGLNGSCWDLYGRHTRSPHTTGFIATLLHTRQ